MPDTSAAAAPKPEATPAAPAPNDNQNQAAKPNEPKQTEAAAPKHGEMDPKLVELAKQTRLARLAAQTAAKEREGLKAERAALKAESDELARFRQLRESAKRGNLEPLAKYAFGEKWLDTLTEYKINGAPPQELVHSAVDEKLAEIDKRYSEKVQKLEEKIQQREAEAATQAKRDYESEAISFVRAKPDDYPFIHLYGSWDAVAHEIDSHFVATTKIDEVAGTAEPGELYTAKEAADIVEKRIREVVERGEQLKQKQKQAPVPGRDGQPQRRTLSTALSGSQANANNQPKPGSDRERLQRAEAAARASLMQRGKLQ